MRDGLWWVDYKQISAGFIIKDNQVVLCAPILVKRFHDLWRHNAVWQCPLSEVVRELKHIEV